MYENELKLLKQAQANKTTIMGFICMDYIMARSVVYAAEAVKKPAIIMLYPEHVRDLHAGGFKAYSEMVKELADEVSVPISLHIDHDYDYDSVMNSIHNGFESVMIDGSVLTLEDNIALTKKVVQKAHTMNVCVEGEIGHVGNAGLGDNNLEDLYTNVDAAKRYCEESGVDSLAVSIGNAHGEYKKTPKLDMERLEQIRDAVGVPLVLHGGSGIPDDQLLEAFSKGISKFNLGTDYLKRYFDALAEFTKLNMDNKDLVKIINMPSFVEKKLQPYVEERLVTLCKLSF